MRNRAKCKSCNSVLESFHRHDFVTCKCGAIAIDGGQESGYMRAVFDNIENFVRLDEQDNEIPIKFVEKETEATIEKREVKTISKSEQRQLALQELKHLRDMIEGMNEQAKQLPINHYDWGSLLILLSILFED